MGFREEFERELRKDMFIKFCMYLGRGRKPVCPYCGEIIKHPTVRSRTCGKEECKKKHKKRYYIRVTESNNIKKQEILKNAKLPLQKDDSIREILDKTKINWLRGKKNEL